MRGIVILGSTGSIGTQALDVISRMPDEFQVVGLAAGTNIDLLETQIRQFRPKAASLAAFSLTDELKGRELPEVELLSGQSGLQAMVERDDVDLVLNAVVGSQGIRPTLAAIKAGKDVALANKETLVAAGSIIMQAVKEHNVRILPVDSEHNAIFQCLQGVEDDYLQKIILTASGGPFRKNTAQELEQMTPKQALDHPTWNMGDKVTIDSATLMNKGLEVIEAHWLFGLPGTRIDVVIHPQSIIHSLIELIDGSVLAQLGVPDMRLPIQYALTYPKRSNSPVPLLSLAEIGSLEFEEPDMQRFPCLGLAFDVLKAGGTYPTVLNAANEAAVEAFLKGQIGFMDIPRVVNEVLQGHQNVSEPDLHDILEMDSTARKDCALHINRLNG